MPRIGDYDVLVDAPFSLNVGGVQTLNVTLPTGSRANNAVLSFMIDTDNNAQALQFRIAVNNTPQATYTYSGAVRHSIHEAVNGLQVGNNTVTFQVLNGVGTLQVADVALFFQRDIP